MKITDPTSGRRLSIRYHKADGTVVEREVIPLTLEFRANPFYKEPQWLLGCWDLTRDAYRTYALAELEPADGGSLKFTLAEGRA